MNKYMALGLTMEALLNPRRFMVVTRGQAASEATFRAAATAAKHALAKIRAVNGDQRIDYPNGSRITFVNANSAGHRGQEVDTVIFDEWRPASDQLADIAPCVQTSPTGEIIHA